MKLYNIKRNLNIKRNNLCLCSFCCMNKTLANVENKMSKKLCYFSPLALYT